MALIRVAGFDPSLRNTGYGILNYDDETDELWPSFCGLIQTPVKYTGTDAILYKIEELYKLSQLDEIKSCQQYIVESPAAIYYSGMSSGGLIPVAHVAGACASILCLKDNVFNSSSVTLVRPVQWNKTKKKNKTESMLIELFGPITDWDYHRKPRTESKLEHVVDAIGMAFWYMQEKFFTVE
jgi:hypothetical protein